MQVFRSKPRNVKAIQWVHDGERDTTEDVIRFLDAEFGGESSVGPSINLIARVDGLGVIVAPGSWVIRDTADAISVLSDEHFREHYEPARGRAAA